MREGNNSTLSLVLNRLADAGEAESVSVADVVETIGTHSLAALMLIFALIAVSPASLILGATAAIAVLEFVIIVQMVVGRRHLWLPGSISRLTLPGALLRTGIEWLRRPVAMPDRLLRPRLPYLTEAPVIHLWLILTLGLTIVMPFMELVPGTGTLASTVIALVAAAILTRDGALILIAVACLAALAGLLGWLGDKIL
jgi:hypothetical protein